MKLFWKMPSPLKVHFKKELSYFKDEFNKKNLVKAWHHLERAHIIGQAWPGEHNFVHWKMLKFGFYIKSPKEVAGQIPRLFIGGIKSFVGEIPVGNTGGANVPPLKPMEIPDDIKALFEQSKP